MKIYVRGHEVRLTKQQLAGSGGEGDVYVVGSTAYKIYNDPSKIIPVGKVQELAAITEPRVIKPEEMILDEKGKTLGYTMKFVPKSTVLCQIFTRAFRERNGITPEKMFKLVRNMQEGVHHVHNAGVLIVDLNEMNFLVNDRFDEVFFIDVDSYQTPHFRATALMESVRDRHGAPNDFNEGTDWFSFAVTSFQMQIGIHPFKGKHPTIKDWDERMQRNISVFHRDVSMPKVCYPLDVLPPAYRKWYEAVFEHGDRNPPPSDPNVVKFVPLAQVQAQGALVEILNLASVVPNAGAYWWHNGIGVAANDNSVWVEGRITRTPGRVVAVGFTPRHNRPIGAVFVGSKFTLCDLTDGVEIPFGLDVDEVMSYGGSVYVKCQDQILEVAFHDATDKVIAAPKLMGTVLPHASRMYEGCVIQRLLGTAYVSLFPGDGVHQQIRMQELDNKQVVEARFDRGVLMVLCLSKGKYTRHVFRFNEGYTARDHWTIEDVAPVAPNFVVLDSGVVVNITEDEQLALFSSSHGSTSQKRIDPNNIGGDMILRRAGNRVVFLRGNTLHQLKMK